MGLGFVLTSTSPPSSFILVSQLHKFSSGVKTRGFSFRPHRTLISKSCCFNLPQEPILSEALKEPIAFVGGMFAGLLRLDLNEEPLKEWVTRTVEAEEEDGMVSNEEDAPQQIEIE